jgi:O-glycosyl hydrolase
MLPTRFPLRTSAIALAAATALMLGGSHVFANRLQPGDAPGVAARAQAAASGGAAFQGFGASGAWWARDTGGMPAADRARIARLLFSRRGLGLTMYRYNIGGGGRISAAGRWAPGYLRADGSYDWSADAAGRDMLRRAVALGVRHVVGFANAAPPQFTTNGKGCGGELRSDRVQDYAAYLARVIQHLTASGFPVELVSPMNEPDSSFAACQQEGMKVPVPMRAGLIRAVQSALAQDGSRVGVLADESSGGGALLNEAPNWLGGSGNAATPAAFAYHAYDAPDATRLRAIGSMAASASRPAFMSEICCMKRGRFGPGYDPGMTSGMWLARTIWRNLTLGGASSFSWWVALSPELGCDARSAACGASANKNGWDDGLIYYDRDYRSDRDLRLVMTKRYWVYAQFSRWITPGMRPHIVTGAPSGAQVLVFSGDGRTVVVGIPPAGATRTTSFSLHLPWLGSARASVYRTSATRDASALPGVAAIGGTLRLSLPPTSVTTYVVPGPG